MIRRARATAIQLLSLEASLSSLPSTKQLGSPPLHGLLQPQQAPSSSIFSSSSIRRFSASPPSGGSSPSRVIAVKGDTEYLSALSLAQENQGLAVVYFTAKWCGPCKMISPIVDELSTKYDKATFLKVDIDEEKLSEIVSDERIASVPTFRFFQGGKAIGDVIGANANALKDKLAALIK